MMQMVTYSLLVTTKPNIVCRVGWHSTTVRPRCLKTVRSSVLETSRWPIGKKVAKKVGMQNIKLFASVKNLCVFTKYTGFDPEVNTRQGQTGDLMPSLDYSAYPRNRSYSVGFNFIF